VPDQKQKEFLDAKAARLKVRAEALKARQPAPKAPLPFKNLNSPGGSQQAGDPRCHPNRKRRLNKSQRAQIRLPSET